MLCNDRKIANKSFFFQLHFRDTVKDESTTAANIDDKSCVDNVDKRFLLNAVKTIL